MAKGYDFFGEKIKKLRKLKDVSQSDLGKVLNLPKQSISRIEKNQRRITPEELDKISEFFEIPKMFFTSKYNYIDSNYDDYVETINKYGWGDLGSIYCLDALNELDEYYEYSIENSELDIKCTRRDIKGMKKALDKILAKYEEILK